MRLLSFGEIIWDVYPDKKFIGGAPFNFAAHARRAGADTYLLSAVGNDALGAEALEWVRHYGVSAELVAVNDRPTGECRVTLDLNGVPSYEIVTDTAYDMIPPIAAPRDFDVLAFGTLALRGENNRSTIKKLVSEGGFKEIFVDLNIRPPFGYRESILLALESATILKVSDEELPAVMTAIYGEYHGIDESTLRLKADFAGLKIILVTCGGSPARAYDFSEDKIYTCDSVKTEVVSTVGAGDSYGATVLVHYMNGSPVYEAMCEAAKVSAFVVSRTGAIPEE